MADIKQYVFFDFEMLCSHRGMEMEEMEAIRLGAVKHDLETGQIFYFDRFIKPLNRKALSAFCKKLTGIKDSDLRSAHSFGQVFEEFLNWIGGVKRTRFFSWSKSDLSRLKMDAKNHGVPEGMIKKIEKRYVDFQAIFAKRVSKNTPSVENALALYGLDFEGEKHNPVSDSYNTFRIYQCFSEKVLQSDLIMLKQFIFDKDIQDVKQVGYFLKHNFKKDLDVFVLDLRDMYVMKDAKKMIKQTQRLVEKYENIIINRSGIFAEDIIESVRLLVHFFHQLLASYDEHFMHSSKIMILDEQLMKQVQHLSKTS
ncbi:3'-5' exonuclease [Bacillus sp. T33-2]|uniref:3'-5' exonuclease n=1 Tax=Bacillus sp. T33-2 TaxID=2054168 RepID=UPI000C769B54|nr:3'-5' exonuclease [Bacillus sp. T33-2]PLR98754.1 exonuclease [Bacillus sp. T33-2]